MVILEAVEQDRHGAADGVPQALGRLRVALNDAFERASRDLGLTAQQAELICAAMQPAAVGDLAEALRCDRSNVTRLVDRASAHELFRRYPGSDRRVSMIGLTPKGERLARRFLTTLEEQTAGLRAAWPDARKKNAIEVLDELSAALEASRPGGDALA